jgi:ferredoxin
VPDFEKVEQVVDLLRILPLPQGALRGIRRLWAARPRIVNGKCTRCGVCEKGCPVSGAAIHPKSEPGRQVEDDRCIACYCCHEFCPHQAIELVQPWLTRWLPMTAMANGAAKIVGMFGSGRRRSRSSEPPDGARS